MLHFSYLAQIDPVVAHQIFSRLRLFVLGRLVQGWTGVSLPPRLSLEGDGFAAIPEDCPRTPELTAEVELKAAQALTIAGITRCLVLEQNALSARIGHPPGLSHEECETMRFRAAAVADNQHQCVLVDEARILDDDGIDRISNRARYHWRGWSGGRPWAKRDAGRAPGRHGAGESREGDKCALQPRWRGRDHRTPSFRIDVRTFIPS